jgi:chromosome segregation ATPase
MNDIKKDFHYDVNKPHTIFIKTQEIKSDVIEMNSINIDSRITQINQQIAYLQRQKQELESDLIEVKKKEVERDAEIETINKENKDKTKV